MANSSKEYDCTNRKVIVIKSNELFTLKQLGLQQQRERLEEFKKNLTGSNVTFLSKVCEKPDTSTPECSSHTQPNVKHPRSLIKLPKYICGTPCSHKAESAPNKKYKRKISVVENGLEKTKLVDFADLSRATITSTTETHEATAEKDVENETINPDNISEEKVMELIDKKYGAALEAQLNFFRNIKDGECTTTQIQVETPSKSLQEVTVTQGPVGELPSDIYEYKAREDEFLNEIEKEQDVSEEVKEAQKHLETIMISDSPDDGYTLFTREELKKLPEKIFESPVKSEVKEEIVPKEENLEYSEKLNSSIKDDTKVFIVAKDAEVETKIVTNQGKKVWEYDSKHIEIILSDLKNISSINEQKKPIPEENTKKIIMANEDTAIFKEIDEFIKEISVKDKNQLTKETSSDTNERRDASDHDYCRENIEIDKECNEIDEIKTDVKSEEGPQKIADESLVECPESTNICVDAARFENAIKCIIYKNELLEQGEVEEKEGKTEENATETQVEPKKNDILARLIQESEIHIDQTKPGDVDFTNPPDESRSTNVDIPEEPVQAGSTNNNQTGFDDFSGQFKSNEQLEISQSAILIIKENGFLEPLNLDTAGSNHGENKEQTHCSETEKAPEETSAGESVLNEEPRKTTDRIDREEILAMLEKARAVQYDNDHFDNGDGTGKENLKHFARSLKGQVGVLKKLYERLEIDARVIEEELDRDMTVDELSELYDGLNFIKIVIDKSFVKEEKKLKYKVISIRRKSTDRKKLVSPSNKPITKRVYNKITVPRCAGTVSNKLLRKTLFRMDKLLEIVEKNQTLLVKTKRKAFVSKLNEITEMGPGGKDLLVEEPNVVENCKSGEIRDSTILNDRVVKENATNVELSLENNNGKSRDDKSKQPLKLPTETVKFNTTNINDGKDPQEKENFVPSPRYPLRSRQKTSASLPVNHTREREKDVPVGKTGSVLPYEVNYSNVVPLNKIEDRKLDYVLKNDNKPCVVLYRNKDRLDKPIFETSNVRLPKKNLVVELTQVVSGNKAKERRVLDRYKTRSKMEKIEEGTQRVLRSRKI